MNTNSGAKDGASSHWNVAFLVRDYPENLRTVGPWHFNGRIDEAFLAPLRQLDSERTHILEFLAHYDAARFTWFGLQVPGRERLDALSEAHHRLEGMIDGVAVCNAHIKPVVSDLAWIAPEAEADLRLVVFRRQNWADRAGSAESAAKWDSRQDQLRMRIVRFYSFAIDQHSRSQTPLARQLRHSLRMFRHGQHSGSWGVEFICKFCALEGLVCGPTKDNKFKLLSRRLGALLPGPATAAMISQLWNFRNAAVHTAQAFDAGCLDEGAPLGVHIEEIEYLFVAALVFTLQHIDAADDVSQLWKNSDPSSLPEFTRWRRPDDTNVR
ncbi:MAG: hypothetical protein HYV96_19575 [Opitutae bacterium]|nr:hypothetical protein [Opitutae bacterium]